MPAKSKVQQKAAGAALAAKRGKTPKSKLRGASRGMYDSMSESQLEEFAATKRKGKPTRKAEPARKTTKASRTKTGRKKAGTAAAGRGGATTRARKPGRKAKTTRKAASKGRSKASR